MSDTAKIMIIGGKESFLIRVLIKKLAEQELTGFYVPADVDAINRKLSEASVIAYYMESNEFFPPDVLQFLKDKLDEIDQKLILIGEKNDTDAVEKALRGKLIHKTFLRPLDNEAFIAEIRHRLSEEEKSEEKKTILIVDDDPTYLGLVRDWLREDYKVAMANSGLQAIKWLGKNKADLILLDHEMPVTSGPQVLEMLRSDHETAAIPVFFLTGKSDKASVMQVVDLKPEGYLLKSVMDRIELLEKLDKFFRR